MRMDLTPPGRQRIDWIDAMRGVTIMGVVVFHGFLAFAEENADAPVYLENLIVGFGGLFRMSTFFLCAGVVLSLVSKDKLNIFLRKRIRVLIWCVLLWTLIYLLLEKLGIHLYPWEEAPYVELRQMLLVPYGSLWFIYAIFFLSIFAVVMDPWALSVKILVTAGATLALFAILGRFPMPVGLELLVSGLAAKGLPFFMAGFVFGDRIVKGAASKNPVIIAIYAGCLAFVAAFFLLDQEGGAYFMASIFAATLIFSAVICLCVQWGVLSAVIEEVGRGSLEILLLHPIFIGLIYGALEPILDEMNQALALFLLCVPPIVCSFKLAQATRRVGGRFFFAPPRWFWPARAC